MIAFLTVSILLIVAPGPDFALTVRNAVARGRRAGAATAAGVTCGLVVWAVAAAAGVAALLVASHPAFVALRVAGATYLVLLGLQALRNALRGSEPAQVGRRGRSPYAQGFVSNLANPKIAIFFTSLLPQFGTSFAALLGHGLLFGMLTLVWLIAVALIGSVLRIPPVRRSLEAVCGVVLIGFGGLLATSRR